MPLVGMDDECTDIELMDKVVEVVSCLVAILAVLGIVSDTLAYLIGSRLKGNKSSKSLMKMQAFVDTLQCIFLFYASLARLESEWLSNF